MAPEACSALWWQEQKFNPTRSEEMNQLSTSVTSMKLLQKTDEKKGK